MDLLQAIRQELESASVYYQQNPYNGAGWTSVTHQRIGNLAAQYAGAKGIGCGMPTGASPGGKRIAVCIAGNFPPSVEGQFLFDQCWLTCYDDDNSPANGDCVSCDLAIETEWDTANRDDFHRDFLKLVLGKAKIKVMVFWTKELLEGNDLISELERQIKNSGASEEKYLLSFFCWEDCTVHHFEI